MSTKIRLARYGSKKYPTYKIVVSDSARTPRGRFIEQLGKYQPLLDKDSPDRFSFNKERVLYWLSCGAIPSETISKHLFRRGIIEVKKFLPKGFPTNEAELKKALELRKQHLEAKKKSASKTEDDSVSSEPKDDKSEAKDTKSHIK